METIFTTLTDHQRLEVLNTIYRKGLSTPQQDLAFSADKLVYLKPFLSKLQHEVNEQVTSLTSSVMVRQVVDELLMDIKEEIDATCARVGEKHARKLAFEYGLHLFAEQYEEDFYFANRVA